MRLLALDLATRIGFAVGSDGGEPTFGAMRLPKTGDDIGSFVVAFDEWIEGKLENVDLAVFECPMLPRLTSFKTVRKLNSLPSHLEFFCRLRRIECREVKAAKIKQFWTGRGNAKKPAMIEAARQFGYPLTDQQDDEADALALYWYSVATINPDAATRFKQGE